MASPSSTPTPSTSAQSSKPTYSAEYLAEDFSYWPRVGIYLTCCIAIIFMLLRVYARIVLIKYFGLDDLLMVFAVICNTVVTILSIRVINYGAGKNVAAIPPEDFVMMFKYLVAAQLLYMITLWLCRISGLAFYARITKNVIKLRTVLIVSWVVVSLTMVGQLLVISLQCIPLERMWNPMSKGKCVADPATFAPTLGTIICDALLLIIPILIITKLVATTKRKLLLAFVMCFGVFSVVASIFRIFALIPMTVLHYTDISKYLARVLVWSSTEITSAVIALCMPSLKPLFSSLLSDSPLPSLSNSPKHSANSEQPGHRMKVLHQKNRVRIASAPTTDINDSEENLWVDGPSPAADSHAKINSSANVAV